MKTYTRLALISFICTATFAFLVGCGGGSSPTFPGSDHNLTDAAKSDTPNSRLLWGFWNIQIDPSTLEATISENRSAQFNANVLRFLQPPDAPINLLTVQIDIGSSDVANDLLAIDITIRHPFIGYNKFRGFDVRGIFMGDWSISSGHDPSATYPNWFAAGPSIPGSEPVLLNADGYTRWWNPTEFTDYGIIFGYTSGNFSAPGFTAASTVNAYKYFADSLESEDPFSIDPATRGSFSTQPGINTRRYLIQFDSKPWQYNYAVDASWAKPADDGAPDYAIDSFPPEANCQEPYDLRLSDAGSSAFYVDSSVYGGDFTLNIEVFDWQADPSVSQSGVLDEISSLWLESLAFDDGSGNHYLDVLAGDFDLLPGSGVTSSIIQVDITPDFSVNGIQQSGPFPIFIAAVSSDPATYEPQIDGGGTQFAYPATSLTAYATGIVNVSGISSNPPVVLSIVPDIGVVDHILNGVQVNGSDFMDGATVTFFSTSSAFTIGPILADWVSSNLLTFDLDLTGADIGFYDVTVENPDAQQGTLPSGFRVVQPVLVLEDEIAFDPYHADYDNYTPAICVETDNDIVFSFEEYNPVGNTSYASARRSKDDGSTWPDVGSSFVSFGGEWRHGDADKIWPASYGTSYRTLTLIDHTYSIWATGFLGTTFNDVGPWPDGAHVTHNISHFTELLQDAEKYVYTLGDKDNIISFKRSEVPEYIMGGPSGAVWASFPLYTLANPGAISRARSSALFNGTMYLAYYEDGNNIVKLAKATDYLDWDTSTVIWDGAGSDTFAAHDPGLCVDETGFYSSFVRLPAWVDHDQLCYTYSPDGLTWSDPVVIHEGGDIFPLMDSPIIHYDWDGISILGVVWWEGPHILAAFSVDNGLSWSDAIDVSGMSPDNKQSDLVVSPTGNWHFVFAGLNDVSDLYEIHYRRGHMEMQ